MKPWSEGRLCGFDLETTGVSVEEDRVVTACVALVGGGAPTESRTWLVDPGVEIPEEATAVHGITTGTARAEGRPAGEVVTEIVTALAEAQRAGIPIVAMNASFDLTILDREARRHGVAALGDLLPAARLRVIDPRVLDKEVDTYRPGGRRLEDLCRHYRVALDGAHRADADAVAACRVAWRIARTEPAIGHTALDTLHQRQITWARDQATSLADYFRRTPGKETWAADVRTEWPLIPAQRTR
ncbi:MULTISPECIES: 3'-5' exonuclease [unclassified Streptomyces]|uniref:3'-5' exonuclease n=1 Tax=unclassified Streptomyces TaxID=2593676 RepID=UPI000CD53CAA|nr:MULTISPECIES: 3'-5' exonuclease [unclassified Streptomyces]